MKNTDHQLSFRKIRDRAVVLLLLGCVFLLPPFADISLLETSFAGIPAPLLYMFVVWAILIVGAWALSGPLRASVSDNPAADNDDKPG